MRYTALPLCTTPASAVIPQRSAPAAPGLNLDSPAVAAMTNFAHECPVTVRQGGGAPLVRGLISQTWLKRQLATAADRVAGPQT